MKNDVCGIYMIENKNTKQRYIGQSIHIYQRWNEHINQHKTCMRIDRAIKKHGADNFDLKVICELEQDDDLLNEMEKYYIWKYNTFEDDFHYNLTPGGDFNPSKVPEIAEKISKANFGKRHSEKTRKKISKANSGKKLSEDTKKKMSKAHSGKKLSEGTRKQISEAKSGKNHHMYGKKHSEDTKKKMSKARNTTGYYRVSKPKCSECERGFRYEYRYYDDRKKQHAISSVDIKKLEKKVKAKGLEWFKLEE